MTFFWILNTVVFHGVIHPNKRTGISWEISLFLLLFFIKEYVTRSNKEYKISETFQEIISSTSSAPENTILIPFSKD